MKSKKVKKGRGQAIPHQLNLEGWVVTGASQRTTHLELKIEMTNPLFPHHCSSVGEDTVADDPCSFGSKTVNIRDLPLNGQYIDLEAKRPRLKCRKCGKVGAAHAGRDLGKDIHSRHRMTTRLIDYIQVQAGSRTFCEVGREIGLPEATVRKIFKENPPPTNLAMKITAPRVLGIDDKHTTGKIKKTVFVDLENKFLLDVYDANAADALVPFVKCLDNPHRIEAVCIDMSGTYLSFCRKYLPWANVVIDKFHFLMKANDAVNTVRVRIQKTLSDDNDDKRKLAGLKKAFLRRKPIDVDSRTNMKRLMKEFPELCNVWEAKERFYGFYSQATAEDADNFYKNWLKNLNKSTRFQFKSLHSCMKNHRNEILNYFRVTTLRSPRRVTNGYLEALNLQIERILHQAPEYKFETLRHKLLKAYGPNREREKRPEFRRRGLKEGGRRERLKPSKSQSPFNLETVLKIQAQEKIGNYKTKSKIDQLYLFSAEELPRTKPPRAGKHAKD